MNEPNQNPDPVPTRAAALEQIEFQTGILALNAALEAAGAATGEARFRVVADRLRILTGGLPRASAEIAPAGDAAPCTLADPESNASSLAALHRKLSAHTGEGTFHAPASPATGEQTPLEPKQRTL